MIENSLLAEKCLNTLDDLGVRQFVVCAGARNAPLVKALQRLAPHRTEYEVLHFFEERSAAFFALGRVKALEAPVAVITTSGTAVGELLPAAMEAHHAGLPLVLVTADRPKSYRGSGAPQTTEQVGLFSNFVEAAADWDGAEQPSLGAWKKRGPLHVNICFPEPL